VGTAVARLVRFQLEGDDSSFVYMEVDEKLPVAKDEDEENLIGIGDEVVVQAQQKLEEALAIVRPVANTIIEKVKSLNQPADAVEVKFGVKMSAELGAIIASGSAEVNYEITLKWNGTGESSG